MPLANRHDQPPSPAVHPRAWTTAARDRPGRLSARERPGAVELPKLRVEDLADTSTISACSIAMVVVNAYGIIGILGNDGSQSLVGLIVVPADLLLLVLLLVKLSSTLHRPLPGDVRRKGLVRGAIAITALLAYFVLAQIVSS